MSLLRGRRYNRTKRTQSEAGSLKGNFHQNAGSLQTAEVLAEQHGVSKATIERDGKFVEAAKPLVEAKKAHDKWQVVDRVVTVVKRLCIASSRRNRTIKRLCRVGYRQNKKSKAGKSWIRLPIRRVLSTYLNVEKTTRQKGSKEKIPESMDYLLAENKRVLSYRRELIFSVIDALNHW
jgi:hypothetical protein